MDCEFLKKYLTSCISVCPSCQGVLIPLFFFSSRISQELAAMGLSVEGGEGARPKNPQVSAVIGGEPTQSLTPISSPHPPLPRSGSR